MPSRRDIRYPSPSSPAVSKVMRANVKTGTKPEVAVRSELHRRGLRFRKNHALRVGDVRTIPDIVFPKQRLAVFIDGCFWHRCPLHGSSPRSNSWYWSEKLSRNVERDVRTAQALTTAGWTALRFWEHERADGCAIAIADALALAPKQPDRRH